MVANSLKFVPTFGPRLHDQGASNDLTAGPDLGVSGPEDMFWIWRQGQRPDPNQTVPQWAAPPICQQRTGLLLFLRELLDRAENDSARDSAPCRFSRLSA